jgi:hypothetical protein
MISESDFLFRSLFHFFRLMCTIKNAQRGRRGKTDWNEKMKPNRRGTTLCRETVFFVHFTTPCGRLAVMQ